LKFIDRAGADALIRNSESRIGSQIPWDYEAVWDSKSNSFVEKSSQEKLTFDFHRSHNQKVLLHHQAGGGLDSGRLLLLMGFTPHLKNLLDARLSMFPKDYAAAHVRHSDYESDYEDYLPKTISKKMGVLFLSTDNETVIEWVRINLPWVRTVSYQKLQNRNVESLCDLFMLANGRVVIPVPLANNRVAFSGYSRLASLIWVSIRPSLLLSSLSLTRLSQLKLTLQAIGGVRGPLMSILRLVAFSPLLLQCRFSRFGVIADLRKVTRFNKS
jgi:hypothetical protein